MMFLRHGIFARRGRQERRRNLVVASTALLVLVAVASIIGIVKAAGTTADLGGSTGLTRGDIDGSFSYNSGNAEDLARNSKVTLSIDFSIDGQTYVDAAYSADQWVYDLSSLIASSTNPNAIFSSVDTLSGVGITYNGKNVGTYEVRDNKVIITVARGSDSIWDPYPSHIDGGFTVTLNVDPKKIGTDATYQNADKVVDIPGSLSTVGDPNSAPNTATLNFEAPTITSYDYVYDSQTSGWKQDSNGNIGIYKNNSDQYVAKYVTEFKTNAYYDDLTVNLDLSNNQSFTGEIYLAYCQGAQCVDNSNTKKIALSSIPGNLVTYYDDDSDGRNDRVTINMTSVLNYCAVSGSCEVDGVKAVDGYQISPTNAGYGYTYQLLYEGLLEGSPVDTYRVDTNITGTNHTQPTATQTSSTDYVEFTSYSDPITDGTKTAVRRTVSGNDGDTYYIDYTITIGGGVDMSGKKIIDRLTDNQVIITDVTVKDKDGTVVDTIALNGDNRLNSAAHDTNYSNNEIQLFEFTFANNSNNGPYTFEYTVQLPKTDLGLQADVTNKIDLVVNGTTYYDIAHASDKYDFVVPQTYITKEVVSVDNTNGTVRWLVRIFGPDSSKPSGSTFTNITVKDTTWGTNYNCNASASDPKLCTHYVSANATQNFNMQGETTVDLNTAGINLASATDTSGNPEITIDVIHQNEVVNITFETTANEAYRAQYAGQSIETTNIATAQIDGKNVEARASARILQPSPNVMEKSVTKNNEGIYYYIDNNDQYQFSSNREGFTWVVTINKDAKGAQNTDYIPYFTDTIPAGLYLAYTDNNSATRPTYDSSIDPATDAEHIAHEVSQDNFVKKILVERIVNNGHSPSYEQKLIDVTTTTNQDGSITINPVDLASQFNTLPGCNVTTQITPSEHCAGINSTEYKVTYKTTIRESDYRDYVHEHEFTNYAQLEELKSTNPDVFESHAYAQATATYLTSTAIDKIDESRTDLTGNDLNSDNLIEYKIIVNREDAQLNAGNDLAFSDKIENNMAFYNEKYFDSNDARYSSPYNTPIVCLDNNDQLVSSCAFTYDSNTRTLSGTIPDEKYLVIKYRARVINPIAGSTQTFTNTAKITNDFGTTYEDTVAQAHTISEYQGYIMVNGTLKISKVDAADTTSTIDGVVFSFSEQAYDASTYALGAVTSLTDVTTANGGIATVSNLVGANVANSTNAKLYYWEEKAAPSPYMPESTTRKHYFVLYDSGQTIAETQTNRDAATLTASSLEAANSGMGTIAILPGGYQWIVTNIAQDMTTLNVEKTVSGNVADPTKEFTITVSATNSRGEAMTGTVNAYSYNLDNPSNLTAISGGVIFTNGSATIQLAHNQGIKIEGVYVGGTYSAVETAEQGYTTSYTCTAASGCDTTTNYGGTLVSTGQTIAIENNAENTLSGKKQNFSMYFALAGGCIAALGAVVLIKVRH